MKKRILVVDDESLIREFIANFFLSTPEYEDCIVDLAVDGDEAIARIREHYYNLIFTDLKMPGKSGLDVIRFVSENSPGTDTVLITAFGGGESASRAMAYGAYEYITKPIPVDELEMIVKHIFERQELIDQNRELQRRLTEKVHFPKIIGRSKTVLDIMDVVKMVAPTSSTVLITGESGTGKELIAEAIHQLSPRAENNFVKINCAAIPQHLIESELFGFEKGAFTGAIKRTRGKFEIAHRGSILLDEISEMDLDLQAKLLRVIQEKEIIRIGSESPQKVDVRVIATSNRDLTSEIEKGNFREDLFFRLNIVPIHLPGLRERKDDIPLLVENFMKKVCFDLGITKKVIPNKTMDHLMVYDWPGNVRELQNAVERAIITTPENVLNVEAFHFLKTPVREESPVVAEPETDTTMVRMDAIAGADVSTFDGKTLAEIEKELIFRTLEKTNNNRTETARILGITTRTLRNKLHTYEEGE